MVEAAGPIVNAHARVAILMWERSALERTGHGKLLYMTARTRRSHVHTTASEAVLRAPTMVAIPALVIVHMYMYL